MREIKFRAWDSVFNEMLYEDTRMNRGRVKEIMLNEDLGAYSKDDSRYKHQPFTFMQYTGLKDKNCVEIYEGDIVEYDNDTECYIANVKWNKYHLHYDVIPLDERNPIRQLTRRKDTYKIIGNIYENKELLK